MKRSQKIDLTHNFTDSVAERGARLLATSALTASVALSMAACAPEPDTTAYVYRDAQECVAAGVFTETACDNFADRARQDHLATAPRFERASDCEEAYGEGSCGSQNSNGGGSSFMPFMMGYMMGNNSNSGSAAYSTPVYRDRGGSYFAAGGASLGSNAFSRAAQTQGVPTHSSNFARPAPAGYQSHASVVSRGGFGARGASMGGSGS